MADLLPCPFCGAPADTFVGEHNFIDAKVRCISCGCETGLYDEDDATAEQNIDAAEAAWNARVPAVSDPVPPEDQKCR